MQDRINFIHLTDLHVADPSVPDEHLFSDTNGMLRTILSEVKRVRPAPAFIIASGDLTNRGDVASYEAFKAIIEEAGLEAPILYALGNHDTRPGFYEAMLGRTENNLAPYDHDAVMAGVHIIVLDSSVPTKVGGAFEPGQLDWLKERLDAHPDLPKLLVMHHAPMLDLDNLAMQWESLTAADTIALRDLVEGYNIVGILTGHVHYDRVSNWYGIPVVVGVGQHAAMDVLALSERLRMVSGASFAIGTLRPSGLTVSFVPQPSDRRELMNISFSRMAELTKEFEAARDTVATR